MGTIQQGAWSINLSYFVFNLNPKEVRFVYIVNNIEIQALIKSQEEYVWALTKCLDQWIPPRIQHECGCEVPSTLSYITNSLLQ